MGGHAVRPKLVMDVTELCCWSGNTTGIVRVERELSMWARKHLQHVTFAFFDPKDNAYRAIDQRWLDALLSGRCVLERDAAQRSSGQRRRFIDRVPIPLQLPVMWVLQFRRQLLHALEDRRLATANPDMARAIDRLQRRVMTEKYWRSMIRPDGSRQSRLPAARVLGPPLEFAANDVLLSVGSAWVHSNIAFVADLKRRRGIKFVVLCHDLILLQFPHYAQPDVVDTFRRYFDVALPTADLVLCASRRVEMDVEAYCRAQGLGPLRIAQVPFGGDPISQGDAPVDLGRLGLAAQIFILQVSTIEPRKGHRMLLEAWRRLMAAGIPQSHGFKLVLVGQFGWKIEELRAELEVEAATGHLLLLTNVDDALLAGLYRQAAFCVYPSEYEGYGLPVVEAFRHGKAVIASNAGALPEVTAGFAPSLEPSDTAAWVEILARWIAEPGARQSYELAIRSTYRPMTWDLAASRFFATLDEMVTHPGES